MKRLKLITKYFMKNALEDTFKSSKMRPWVSIILILFVMACLSAPFAGSVGIAYNLLKGTGQEGTILQNLFISGSTIVFFFGIYSILNDFYFASNIEAILPLPFKSSEVVFAKFLSVLIDMYIYSTILILPLIVYGIVSNAGVLYYIYALLSLICLPVVPMIIGSLLSMILMRFTSLSKHKDGFRTFCGTLMLVLVVVFNIYSQSSAKNGGETTIMANSNGITDVANDFIITNKFSVYALLSNEQLNGLLYILATLLIAIALFVIYFIVGGNLYYKSVVGISETFSKRENVLESRKGIKGIKKNSPIKALVLKDIKIVFRTPQFFINCVAMIFYMPAIMIVVILSGGIKDYIIFGINNIETYGYVLIGIFSLTTFSISSGGTALTAISREGKDYIAKQYIPISEKDFILSKIISSILINEIAAIITIAVLIYLGTPAVLLGMGIILSIGSIITLSLIQLYIDYKSPKLEWETERDMFKGNYKPLGIVLVIILLAIALNYLAFIIENYIAIFAILMALIIVSSIVIFNLLCKQKVKDLNRKSSIISL